MVEVTGGEYVLKINGATIAISEGGLRALYNILKGKFDSNWWYASPYTTPVQPWVQTGKIITGDDVISGSTTTMPQNFNYTTAVTNCDCSKVKN